MTALDFGLGPSFEIVVAGDSGSDDTKAMLSALGRVFVPNKVVLLRPTELESPEIVQLAEFTTYHLAVAGKATAYACRNYQCNMPINELEKMLELLKKRPEVN